MPETSRSRSCSMSRVWFGMSTSATAFKGDVETATDGANSGLRTCLGHRNIRTSPWPSLWRNQHWIGPLNGKRIPCPEEGPEGFQPGGERRAHAYLESFVTDRIRRYAKAISKPEGSGRGAAVERLPGLGQLEHSSGAPASSNCSAAGVEMGLQVSCATLGI